MKQWRPYQWVALVLGTGWLAAQTGLLLEHQFAGGSIRSWTLLLCVPLATLTLAALPTLLEHCVREWKLLKALCLSAMFALLLAFSLPMALSRSGEVSQGRVEQAIAANRSHTLVREQLGAARLRLASVTLQADQECKGGAGRRCVERKEEMEVVQQRVEGLVQRVGALPPLVVERPLAEALASAGLPGLRPEALALSPLLALALAMELGIWSFFWLAFSPSTPRAARKVKVVMSVAVPPVEVVRASQKGKKRARVALGKRKLALSAPKAETVEVEEPLPYKGKVPLPVPLAKRRP